MDSDSLQARYTAKYKAIKGDAVIKKMKLLGVTMPVVKLTDGTKAPDSLFRYLLASYGSQMGQGYHFDPDADEAAALLSYDSLCEAIDTVSGHMDGPNYPSVLPLVCRYGNAQQIKALTDAWKSWGVWETFGKKGRNAQTVLSEALTLSNTHQAVVWLEKNASLERYASLRNISVADVYEQNLFDFGLNENGVRQFDPGATIIEVTLPPSMELSPYDTVKKKTVKTIPKNGIDSAVQKKAADELADMKQNLKKAAKIKLNQLFQDYLDAISLSAQRWKDLYLKNPFLRAVASMLVWVQGDRCFVLTEGGLADSKGLPYVLTEESVLPAHPMEMTREEIDAWQRFFTAHSLKQPFAQIWEPVYQKESVREDRYNGCRINPLYLKNQQRRGIDSQWYSTEYYEDKHVSIKGFSVEAKDASCQFDDERDYLELVSVCPKAWNRRTNMVIAFLDRITLWDRVRKDDLSVMDLMPGFTLAQITAFIAAAQEANDTNVLAALLEYKNANFADFDPMDEFTLER